MKRTLLLISLVALAYAPAATAKGPGEATIAGPGLDDSIVLRGNAEGDPGSPFGVFVDGTGFFPAVFERTPNPMLKTPRKRSLGPRYTVVYSLPGGDRGTSTVRQDLYPYAAGGPVTYTPPGQEIFGGEVTTRGGWYAAPASFRQTLVSLGLPQTRPPSEGSGSSLGLLAEPWDFVAAVGAATLVALAALAFVRRRPHAVAH